MKNEARETRARHESDDWSDIDNSRIDYEGIINGKVETKEFKEMKKVIDKIAESQVHKSITMKKPMLVTIYTAGAFGVSRTEAKLIQIGREKYAQYDNAPFVVFVPKGKRNALITRATYDPYLIVIEGHGHPSPPDIFSPMKRDENGTGSQMSRYSSFDDRYRTEFDEVISKHMEGKNVLVDMRQTAGKEVYNEYSNNNESAPETNQA